ncbi:MAG: DciA family protein [Parcubacteria group bacterium]
MKALRDLLVKKKAATTTLSDKDIFYIFRRIIKEEYGNVGAEKIQSDFYKNGTLFLKSESSIWSAEAFSNRSFIIRKMNDELGEKVVREIKFK